MNQYILKYKGDDEKELAGDLELIKSVKDLTIIDKNPKLMLVQMSDKAKEFLEAKLHKWSLFPQTNISKPDTKKKVRGKTYK